MKLYEQYINDIENGTRIAGKSEILAVKRHLADLERSKTDNFEYYWDEVAANRVIKFMSKLRLTGGKYKGKLWELTPIQEFYFACVYGWLHKETKYRRFNKVYWCTGRKSAKSEKTGGEEVYQIAGGDKEGNPHIFCVATTREQAKYVYDAANTMVQYFIKDFPQYSKTIRPMQYKIINTDLDVGGYITCLTSDAKTNDGGNPHFASIDEFHAHPDNSMLDIITTGMAMRTQPLIKITTTAGNNKNGPDFAFRKYCKRVLNNEIVDDKLFIMICELDEDDDVHDERNWYKANPLLGITPRLDILRGMYQSAKNEGGEAWAQFLTKSLNQYVDSSGAWISGENYNKCAKYRDIEELKGLKCIVGVDLASEHDTVAFTYLFPPQKGLDKMYYFTHYYCPETKFKNERVDGILYKNFLPNWMTPTVGKVIDTNKLKSDFLKNAEIFEIVLVAYDPFKAVDFTKDLDEAGFNLGKVPQTPQILGSGNYIWKKAILGEELEHDGSPVTAWQMGNIEIYTDGNGNQKIVKGQGKKEKKVDGPVSISNAFVGLNHWRQSYQGELTEDDLGEL